MIAQRQEPVEEGPPDHLVHRVVATDVLAGAHELAGRHEETGRVQASRRGEGGLRLAEAVGQGRKECVGNRQRALDPRRLDGDRLERALAANAAGGGGVERPRQPIGIEAGGFQLDRVRGQVVREAGRERPQPLREGEAERQLLVVAGCAHRHCHGSAADPQLEGLLDGEPVFALLPAGEAEQSHRGRAVGRRRVGRPCHAATVAGERQHITSGAYSTIGPNTRRAQEEDMDTPSMGNRLLAEIVGTFGFFFIGFSGIAASVNLPGSIAPAGVAAGFGLGLGLMIAAFGQISGGHFNPAVTFGLACARKFPSAAVIPYWIAQLIGGFIAVLVAMIIYTNDVKDSLVTNPGVGVSDWRAMLAELVAVFLFVSVIITVATDDSAPWKGVMAPLAIGGFIFVAAVTIGPTSGGSFNPARSIDPAIWALEFRNLWIYIVGPLIGAAIAGGLSIALRDELPESPRSART